MGRYLAACISILTVVAACDEKEASRVDWSTSKTDREQGEMRVAPSTVVADTASGLQLFEAQRITNAPGLSLQKQRWQWRDEKGVAWRVRIDLPGRTRVLAARDGLSRITELTPSDGETWAAINGGFYRRTERGTPVPLGLVVSDGEVVSKMGAGGGSGVFQVTDAGPSIVHRSNWSSGPSQALQSVDRIADDGESVVESRNPERTARSAVAVGPEHLWFVALAGDGSIDETDFGARLSRTSGHGVPLHIFADYVLASTGGSDVLNLDGGVSTQLEVRAGDEHFLVRGVRPVVNALIARPNPAP